MTAQEAIQKLKTYFGGPFMDEIIPALEAQQAEAERLQAESDEWDKHSLVQIVAERDKLRARVKKLQLMLGQALVECDLALNQETDMISTIEEAEQLRQIVIEAHNHLEAAWNDRRLPASVIPAGLAQRMAAVRDRG